MDTTYELISDDEIKVTRPLPPEERVFSCTDLCDEKENLLREISDFNTRCVFETATRQARITEIDAVLLKVDELRGHPDS